MSRDLMTIGPPSSFVADQQLTTAAFVAFTEGPAVDAE